MGVPKCKECDKYEWLPLNDYSPLKEHYCHYYKNGAGWLISDGKRIKAKEMVSSPKWCPKRSI